MAFISDEIAAPCYRWDENPFFITEEGIYTRTAPNDEVAAKGDILPPSDHGLDGAIPLPPPEWVPGENLEFPGVQASDVAILAWAEQNRRINALLMRSPP